MSEHQKNAQTHVNRALSDILSYGFDDVVNRPIFHPHFELDLLRKSDDLKNKMRASGFLAFNKNKISEMGFSPIDYFFRPKARYLQRRCAYIEPKDLIKYQSLVASISKTIEENRVHRSKSIVHSYRYNKTGKYLFSQKFGYATFKEKSRKESQKKKFNRKIITDISGFYDRINIHRIESQLLSIGCDREAVSKINDLLLTWNNRDSYGLPVGCNASRMLAEAALIDIDRYLISQNITYVRFVDDFRIFASDVDEAAYYLQILQTRLSEDGLTLNSEKTFVVPAESEEQDSAENGKAIETEKVSDEAESDFRANFFDFYKSKIPLSYRAPSESTVERLKQLDIEKEIKRIELDFSSGVSKIKDIIRAIIFQDNEKSENNLVRILKRYVEIVPYAVDMIIEEKDIAKKITSFVAVEFEKWLLDEKKKPDYVTTSIIRLLVQEHPEGKHVVARFLEKLPRHGNSIVGREIYLSLMPSLDRGEALQIRRFYSRATLSERRAIIKGFVDNRSIHAREKEAWLKTVRATNSDMFIECMIAGFFKEKPKNAKKASKAKSKK